MKSSMQQIKPSTDDPKTPTLVRKHGQLTPMGLSPEEKRPKLHSSTATAPAPTLQHKDSKASLTGSILRSKGSLASLRTPTLVKAPTLGRKESVKSIKDPEKENLPLLKRSDSVQSFQSTQLPVRKGTIRKTLRKVSAGLPFIKKRERPGEVPPPLPPQYNVIRSIEDDRIQNGQVELFVVRHGVEGRWEPAARISREAPETYTAYWNQKRVQQ